MLLVLLALDKWVMDSFVGLLNKIILLRLVQIKLLEDLPKLLLLVQVGFLVNSNNNFQIVQVDYLEDRGRRTKSMMYFLANSK